MKKLNPDDPAFPADASTQTHSGVTVREYFAAKLMSMEVPASEIEAERRRDITANPYNTMDKPTPRSIDQIIADRAVQRTDALIKALNQESQ